MVARWLGLVTGLALAIPAAPAFAAPDDAGAERRAETAEPVQKVFGFGAQAGFFNPLGLALRVGLGPVALEGAAGFVPVLLSYGDRIDPDYEIVVPFEVSPQLLLGDIAITKTAHLGFRLGYRYNTSLGHGGTLGGQAHRRWTHVQLEGMLGLSVFPQAADRLRQDGVVGEDAPFNVPPSITGGLTIGLMYYP